LSIEDAEDNPYNNSNAGKDVLLIYVSHKYVKQRNLQDWKRD